MSGAAHTTLDIPPFDVTALCRPTLLMVIGSPGSGKTNTVKSLLVELYLDAVRTARDDFPLMHMALYGSKGEGEYGRAIHPVLVHDDVQTDTLKAIVNHQLRMRQDTSEPDSQCDRRDMSLRVILDDVTNSRSMWESKFARFIWRKNRHIELSMWLCSQYVNDVPLWLRQLTSVVLVRDVNNADRRELFKNYGHLFRDYASFSHILSETCKVPGRSLVMDLRAPHVQQHHAGTRKTSSAVAGPSPICYYDWINPTESNRYLQVIRLTHPDIIAELDRRGDPARYDELEEI